jgi:hypothetical protein
VAVQLSFLVHSHPLAPRLPPLSLHTFAFVLPARMADYYSQCVAQEGEGAESNVLLECVSGLIAETVSSSEGSGELSFQFLLVLSAALVFFMQGGFAMLCAGAVRKKNVGNTMLKNLLDACGASVSFWAVGYAFAFGDASETGGTRFVGNANFFLMNENNYSFWMFQYAFSAASATIVAGTLAERCQMAAYLCYSMMVSYCVSLRLMLVRKYES